MAINFDALMTWREFKVLGREEQHDYLQYLVDAYGANAVSFAKMFHNNANTVRRYIADNDIGITLNCGNRVDHARWNQFLGIQETGEGSAAESVSPEVSSGMRVSSATIRFCGTIDVDTIAAELRRLFDGTAKGEVEIFRTISGE